MHVKTSVDPADILADLRFARDVEALHRLGARALFQYLVELGQERFLRTDLEVRTRRWARLDRATLESISSDQLPWVPLRLVWESPCQ